MGVIELLEEWPNIITLKKAPDDADHWQNVDNKPELLKKEWP